MFRQGDSSAGDNGYLIPDALFYERRMDMPCHIFYEPGCFYPCLIPVDIGHDVYHFHSRIMGKLYGPSFAAGVEFNSHCDDQARIDGFDLFYPLFDSVIVGYFNEARLPEDFRRGQRSVFADMEDYVQ